MKDVREVGRPAIVQSVVAGLGLASAYFDVVRSSMMPSFMWMMRWALELTSESWVTRTNV